MAFWEMPKMEIQTATISISKNLANSRICREMDIARQLQVLDEFICNNFHSPDIDKVLNEFDDLKQNFEQYPGNNIHQEGKCSNLQIEV